MTVEAITAIIGAACTLVTLILIGVRAIVKSAVKDESMAGAFHAHEQTDKTAFIAIDKQFAAGQETMRAINERGIRTEAKVDMLVQWQTGANPETRPAVFHDPRS